MPPTRQDLTQGLFYSEGLGEVRHEPRLMSCWAVQCEPGDPAGVGLTKCNVSPTRLRIHSLNQTRRSSAMLVTDRSSTQRWSSRSQGAIRPETTMSGLNEGKYCQNNWNIML